MVPTVPGLGGLVRGVGDVVLDLVAVVLPLFVGRFLIRSGVGQGEGESHRHRSGGPRGHHRGCGTALALEERGLNGLEAGVGGGHGSPGNALEKGGPHCLHTRVVSQIEHLCRLTQTFREKET